MNGAGHKCRPKARLENPANVAISLNFIVTMADDKSPSPNQGLVAETQSPPREDPLEVDVCFPWITSVEHRANKSRKRKLKIMIPHTICRELLTPMALAPTNVISQREGSASQTSSINSSILNYRYVVVFT